MSQTRYRVYLTLQSLTMMTRLSVIKKRFNAIYYNIEYFCKNLFDRKQMYIFAKWFFLILKFLFSTKEIIGNIRADIYPRATSLSIYNIYNWKIGDSFFARMNYPGRRLTGNKADATEQSLAPIAWQESKHSKAMSPSFGRRAVNSWRTMGLWGCGLLSLFLSLSLS